MTDETAYTWKDWLRGAYRSSTVRFAALLAVLPDALLLLQSQFSTLAPFIPDALESRVMQVIALIVLVLRVRTSIALPDR